MNTIIFTIVGCAGCVGWVKYIVALEEMETHRQEIRKLKLELQYKANPKF